MSKCDTYPTGKTDKRWNQIKQNRSGEKWGVACSSGKYPFFFTSLHEGKKSQDRWPKLLIPILIFAAMKMG